MFEVELYSFEMEMDSFFFSYDTVAFREKSMPKNVKSFRNSSFPLIPNSSSVSYFLRLKLPAF